MAKRKAGTPGKPPEKSFKVQIWGAGVKDQFVQASIWRGEEDLPPQIVVQKQFLFHGKYVKSVKYTPYQLKALKTVVELAIEYCKQQGWTDEAYTKIAKEKHRRNMVKIGREIPLPADPKPENEPLFDKSVEGAFRKEDWD